MTLFVHVALAVSITICGGLALRLNGASAQNSQAAAKSARNHVAKHETSAPAHKDPNTVNGNFVTPEKLSEEKKLLIAGFATDEREVNMRQRRNAMNGELPVIEAEGPDKPPSADAYAAIMARAADLTRTTNFNQLLAS